MPEGHLYAISGSTLVEISGDAARQVASGNPGMLAFALLSATLGPGASLTLVDTLKPSMVDGFAVTDVEMIDRFGALR